MPEFYLSAFADEASIELDGQIAALKRNGITHIELRNVSGALTDKSDAELHDIARALSDAGITVSSYGSPIGKSDITADFEIELARFRRALNVCRIMSCSRMRIFSFFIPKENREECCRRYRDEVIRRLSVMLDEADAAGVTLCHENEYKIYGQDPREVRDLLTALPRLRGIYDAANFIMDGCDVDEGWEATLPSLEYLHVKDALRTDEGKAIVPAGEGLGKYREHLSDRRLGERRLCMTIEPHLYVSDTYKKIDPRRLLGTRVFATSDEAFDFAVESLRTILCELGYTEGKDKIWKK